MINSNEYWNNLFVEDTKIKERYEQTRFFVNLAIDNLPRWVSEDICDNSLSICDAGCAEGNGTQLLKETFKSNVVVGVDFSENAIDLAKTRYPDCEFYVGDIKEFDKNFDVIFSSNVLEHFYNPKKIMEKLVACSNKYCILLVPFREYYTSPEHFSYFDFQSFPLTINEEYDLCYYKPINIQGDNIKYWFGEQIIIIYGKKDFLSDKNLTLRELYNGYIEERTSLICDYDKKIEMLKGELTRSNTEKLSLKNQIKQVSDKTNNIIAQIELLKDELSKSNTEKSSLEDQIKQASDKANSIIAQLEEEKNLLTTNMNNLSKALDYMEITQKSRVYKLGLVLRRFGVQVIRERQKKDFIKWVLNKLTGKHYTTRGLNEFDYLENAKRCITTSKKVNVYPNLNKELTNKKETRTIIIFASVPYYDVGGGQRSAQMARTFENLGYQIHYIYGFECTEENVPHMYIPCITHKIIDDIDDTWFKNTIHANTIVIFEIPYIKFKPYFQLAKKFGCFTVYEHIDNWDSTLGCLFYDKDLFRVFVETADLVTVTAKLLGKKVFDVSPREYLYLPNAVNTEIFEPVKSYIQPKDLILATGAGKTLLYFGSLWGEWFDWEKIEYLSQSCKDCEINLIGDYSGILQRVENAESNVHFLGLKAQRDLPAYLQYSDIAILPFKNCEIGKYVSPLKIFEYIAMNKKIISTNLDDIQGYPNVYCSDDKEDWAELVYKDTPLVDTSDFISQNNWYARCGQIISRSISVNNQNEKVSIIVLNYNNKSVIGRCISTLLSHNTRYNYEIIVVDNGSSDGSFEFLKTTFQDKIVLLQNVKNGCSSGRNLGVKNAHGDFVCFLDSDQWIVSDFWLDSALKILKTKNHIGAVSWNAGWFDPGSTTGPIVDYLPNRGISNSQIWFRTDIAYLATSGMLMRRKLFNDIEGFDEYYDPTCYEDTDISLKIRNFGFELAYCPYMSIMHLPHQTTKSGSSHHTELMKKNGTYFYKKWASENPKLLEYYLEE